MIRVAAVNGAGLTAVHETDGLLVDPTPPKVTSQSIHFNIMIMLAK